MQRLWRTSAGRDSTLWPALLLLMVVLVPSAGVLWMLQQTLQNERLAVRQRLADVYHKQLELAKRSIEAQWRERLAGLDAVVRQESPAQAFYRAALDGLADSLIVFDADGSTAYPSAAVSNGPEPVVDDAWRRAEELEFKEQRFTEAAEAYRALAAASTDPQLAARALQAEARALGQAGETEKAVAALEELRRSDSATDVRGRSIAANAELRLLELLDTESAARAEVADRLARRLNEYDNVLPAAQRRFLLVQLKQLAPDVALPTVEAETLAARFLGNNGQRPATDELQATELDGVWQIRLPGGRGVALYHMSTLQRQVEALKEQLPESAKVEAQTPAQSGAAGEELASIPLHPTMPGWRLSVALDDADALDLAAARRTTLFVWIAAVVVLLTLALALLVGRGIWRQAQLARLKNDLVATVSHELKTPLASIRLLVDTLLSADDSSGSLDVTEGRTHEYLEMIARENARLSRLIDNFLTFSRMQRGKQRFDFEPMDAAAAVRLAVAAVAERFDGMRSILSLSIEGRLPMRGDADAIVTVLLNLLDNAWKYSGDQKRIALAACRSGDQIVIAVQDNGIGLSPRAVRRVFDRFYQVDQRLSRTQGGCGLGLSIVRYIVEAHDGRVSVESKPGVGSTFTVTLPAVASRVEQVQAEKIATNQAS